jgi:hypothetical protein
VNRFVRVVTSGTFTNFAFQVTYARNKTTTVF